MSDFKGYREWSRTNWGTSDESATFEQIKTGAILRIADATEKMAQSYAALIAERDHYKRSWEYERTSRATLERRVVALRGVITRLKRRGAR